MTIIGVDILMSLAKHRSQRVRRLLEGVPVMLIDRGQVMDDNLDRERVEASDILASARLNHGIERLDQIKYAILERNGSISIIPKET